MKKEREFFVCACGVYRSVGVCAGCIYVCVSVDTLLCAREIKKETEQKSYWKRER